MIKLTELYTFQNPFIAAASGLCLVHDRFYVVADDENALLSFNRNLSDPGTIHQIFEGELPQDKKARKKVKPDFEAVVFLQDKNALLCLPSGSKKNRNRAALVGLFDFAITEISLKEVYQKLESIYSELNIEGAVILGDKIRLFQRGNGKLHQNALIDLNLSQFLNDKVTELSCIDVNLGKLNSIPLSFTDATLQGNRLWFLAVAENSESTYLDGEFVGAVLGEMSMDGKVLKMTPLDLKSKPEGLAFDQQDFYVVTDDDDRKKPSRLYKGTLLID